MKKQKQKNNKAVTEKPTLSAAGDYHEVPVNPKQKDTLFRMIFHEKEDLLSLYNAVNGTSHSDTSKLEIITLENAIYLNVKNDLAFLLTNRISMYEHQSTLCPNLPLRDLFYIASEYEKLVSDKSLPIQKAVWQSVQECIREGILTKFLTKYRNEAIRMSIFECDVERELRIIRQDSFDEGVNLTTKLVALLLEDNRLDELKQLSQDTALREKLFVEYSIK